LGDLGGGRSTALGLNDLGQVVGEAPDPNGQFHAILYSNGKMQFLNNLVSSGSGWDLQIASGINNNGQIAGYGLIDGQTHAFLLTPEANPVPAPPTINMALLGLAWLVR